MVSEVEQSKGASNKKASGGRRARQRLGTKVQSHEGNNIKDQDGQSVDVLSQIELVPIGSIRPYWRNPRLNDAAVPAVRESLRAFGVNQPLVVDKKNVIIVGHTRYRAMLELGVKKVPVMVADHLNAKSAKAYRIADNKTAENAEWDKKALIPELRGTDLELMGLFFQEADLAKLLSEANGTTFTPVTAEQMDKVLDHQQSHGIGSEKGNEQVRLECPHCGDGFWVSRDVLSERG